MNKLYWGKISEHRNAIYGIAIIYIIIFHVNHMISISNTFMDSIIEYGAVGVDIFLFLSGISLYYSYSKNKDTIAFYKRRFHRIIPTYCMIAVSYMIYEDICIKEDFAKFIADVSMLSFWFEKNKYVWYVALILILYLIYPVIFNIFDHLKSKVRLASFIFIIGVSFSMCFLMYHYDILLYRNAEIALTRVGIFICGCYSAESVYSNKKINIYWWSAIPACIVVKILMTKLNLNILTIERYWYGLLAIALVIILAYSLEPISKGFIYKGLSYLGTMSFELYLSHLTIIKLWKRFGLLELFSDFKTNVILISLLSFGLSYVVMKLVNIKRNKIKSNCKIKLD